MLRAASGSTINDPTSGYSLRVRLDAWQSFLETKYPPMSDVRLSLRRRNNHPCGPWIAWGYDAAGHQWSESTKHIDRKTAEDIGRALERDHASPGAAAARAATLADAVTLLRAKRRALAKAGKRSEATVTFYEFKIGHWRRLLGDRFLLSQLSAASIDKVIDARREEGVTEHTIAKELVALRCALKLAVRAGLWQDNPAAVLPVLFATEYSPRTRTLARPECRCSSASSRPPLPRWSTRAPDSGRTTGSLGRRPRNRSCCTCSKCAADRYGLGRFGGRIANARYAKGPENRAFCGGTSRT